MPGKSKRKQMRYAAKKQNRTVQSPPAVTPAPAAGTAPVAAAKIQTPYVKSPATGKTAAAQYTPELLKHVGTELKITLALSASILAVIIILAFIIH